MRNKARAAEGGKRDPPALAMAVVQERALYRLAGSLLGKDVADKMSLWAHRVYPSVDYWTIFWTDRLCTTNRVVYVQHVEDAGEVTMTLGNPPKPFTMRKIKVVEDEVWPP